MGMRNDFDSKCKRLHRLEAKAIRLWKSWIEIQKQHDELLVYLVFKNNARWREHCMKLNRKSDYVLPDVLAEIMEMKGD